MFFVVFLEISQYSQESTCVRFLKNNFFYKTPENAIKNTYKMLTENIKENLSAGYFIEILKILSNI